MAWGDNTGFCYDGCTTDADCRAGTNYTCQAMTTGPQSPTPTTAQVCYCRGKGDACSVGTQCCSGTCAPDNITGKNACN